MYVRLYIKNEKTNEFKEITARGMMIIEAITEVMLSYPGFDVIMAIKIE